MGYFSFVLWNMAPKERARDSEVAQYIEWLVATLGSSVSNYFNI